MPYALPYPVIYTAGSTAPHGQRTESGVKVLMYSYLIGALVAIATTASGLAPSTTGSFVALCFGFALAATALIMGLVALVRICGDRASFGDEHVRHVRLALAFYISGFIGLAVFSIFAAAGIPDGYEAVSTPGFSYAALLPQRIGVEVLGSVFSAFTFLGAYFIFRGLVDPGDLRLVRAAAAFAVALNFAISIAQLLVFAAAAPQMDAAVATRSVQRVESVRAAYIRESDLFTGLSLFYYVLFAYVAFLVLKGFPALRARNQHLAKPQTPQFVVAAAMPPMVPPFPGYPYYPQAAAVPPPLAAPAPAQPLPSGPVRCPRCQQAAEFVVEHGRYFCRTCSSYV
jgi:hypothetical protein